MHKLEFGMGSAAVMHDECTSMQPAASACTSRRHQNLISTSSFTTAQTCQRYGVDGSVCTRKAYRRCFSVSVCKLTCSISLFANSANRNGHYGQQHLDPPTMSLLRDAPHRRMECQPRKSHKTNTSRSYRRESFSAMRNKMFALRNSPRYAHQNIKI